MKNKQTVLVFANESTEVFARAIKERLSHIKDALCIIIGENEFVSTGLQIAKDLLLNPDGIVIKTAKKNPGRRARQGDRQDTLPRI